MTDAAQSTADAPAWYREAIGTSPERGATDVDGVGISYRAWGATGWPGIVLVHGIAAHGGWWDHIGPLLATPERRVVALDLSGHGDSDRRPGYRYELWAREIFAAASAGGIAGLPVIVGHSLGGYAAMRAANMFPDQVAGAIVVDARLAERSASEPSGSIRRTPSAAVYGSAAEAVSRFRLVPDQEGLGFVMAHIAAHSVQPVPEGWSWKFDPAIFVRPRGLVGQLSEVSCRVALVSAEHGSLTKSLCESIAERLGRRVMTVEIPAAAHHVMLDQPLALVSVLRAVLAQWELADEKHDGAVRGLHRASALRDDCPG